MNKNEYEIMYALERDYWWYQGLHDLVEQFTKRFSTGKKEVKIFDAGCGTGGMLQRLARYGKPTGIDYSEEAIAFCKMNNLDDVHQQNLNDWEPPPEAYDIVISLDVLCHATIADDGMIIKQFEKALKPGGICLINLPAFPLLFRNHDLAVHTRRRYRQKKVATLLHKAGFSIVTSTYRLPHLFFLFLLKKFFETLLSGPQQQSDLKKLPSLINGGLSCLHRLENRLILSGMTIPFGSSVFLVAQKRKTPDIDGSISMPR